MGLVVSYTPPAVNAVALLAAAAPAAVEAAAQHILAASQPLVPVDSGDLKDSGKVTLEGTHATISYAATSPDGYPYGIRQHEDMELHHPNGGQAKFLEQPMHSEGHAVLGLMGAALARVL